MLGQHSRDVRLLKGRINEIEAMLTSERHVHMLELFQVRDTLRAVAGASAPKRPDSLAGRLRWLLTGR